MKKLTVILIALLLTGCVSKPIDDIFADLDMMLANLDYKYTVRENTSTEFFNYYLPSDMVNEGGNLTSDVVKYNDSKIVVNLNIASVVNGTSFGINSFNNDGFFKEEMVVYEKHDNFVKNDDTPSKYLLKIYSDGKKYLVNLMTDELIFYSVCNDFDLKEVIRHMFIIGKSVAVDEDNININYSNKDIIEYVKQPVDLFEYDIPASGFLSDLVHQSNGIILNGDGELPSGEEIIEENEEIAEDE